MRNTLITLALGLWAVSAAAGEQPEADLDALKWVARPVVVFADSPADPRLAQQLAELERRKADLEERDVVILVDTDPAARGPLRQKLHPRDFQVVVIDKDGKVTYRKPDPVTAREVIRLIDRMPLRRQELESGKGQHGL